MGDSGKELINAARNNAQITASIRAAMSKGPGTAVPISR